MSFRGIPPSRVRLLARGGKARVQDSRRRLCTREHGPDHLERAARAFADLNFPWAIFPLVGWGIGLAFHYYYGFRHADLPIRARQERIEELGGDHALRRREAWCLMFTVRPTWPARGTHATLGRQLAARPEPRSGPARVHAASERSLACLQLRLCQAGSRPTRGC